MKEKIAILAEEARAFVREQIEPIFTKEGSLCVPAEKYQFLVRNDVRGAPIHPASLLDEVRQQLHVGEPVGIYGHVPTCRYRCKFCTFPIALDSGVADVDADLLVQELETFLGKYAWLQGRNLTTLYFGGGTPTTLSPEAIRRLVGAYVKSFNVSNAEITLEGSPDTIVENPERVHAAKEAGVNRCSFGVQTFDEKILEACDRRHTATQAETAVSLVKACDFREIIVDLMRGLPYQTLEGFIEDVERLVGLGPDSVFVYRMRLKREAELQNRFWTQRENFPLPSIADVVAMQRAAHLVLTSHGYERVSNAQWSRIGRRYAEDRWAKRVPLFGFGWKAYSLFFKGEVYNSEKLGDWRDQVRTGQLTTEQATRFSQTEEELVWTLFNLKFLKLDARRFADTFGKPLQSCAVWPKLKHLIEFGLLHEESDGSVTATEAGAVVPEETIKYIGSA